MNVTTMTRRALTATCVTGALLALGLPSAHAEPFPHPAHSTKKACPVGMDGLAAQLRSAGLTAQAANIATQLAYRDCLKARAR